MNGCKKYTGVIQDNRQSEESLGCRGSFQKINRGSIFSIERPSFKSSTEVLKDFSNPLLPNYDRRGHGNRNIMRKEFLAPDIKGREVLNFERLQAQDLEEGGIKVQLGDKTIEKLFKIQVADSTDRSWIDEKNRRLAAGETDEQIRMNPPFGRPQRKVSKNVNFAQQGLDMTDKLETLQTAIVQGAAESKADLAQVAAQLALVVGNADDMKQVNAENRAQIDEILKRVAIPRDWRAAGFKHRLYSVNQYRAESGLINLYLLSNLGSTRSFDRPIYVKDTRNPVSIHQIVNNLSRNDSTGKAQKFLDLKTRLIISSSEAMELANQGVDGGVLNDREAPPDGWNPAVDVP